MYKQPFEYCIDFPNSIVINPFAIIRGWITCDKGNIISQLSLYCSNKYIQSLTTVNRPDVERVYPNKYVIGFSEFILISDSFLDKKIYIEFFINDEKYDFPVDLKIDQATYKKFLEKKNEKLNKIRNIVSCPLCNHEKELGDSLNALECANCQSKFRFNNNNYNFLSESLIDYANVKPTANISANNYDSVALDLIKKFQDGLILDNGCGLRNVYYENVINFEIVDYPTTDVIGIGEKLPFKSGVFDAVFSLAVLEHVKNPFECAKEIARVIKPNGILYAAVPFLQPFHGYPDHYYNMTSSGITNLFSKEFEILECSVPAAGLPIWCLTWFLNSYINGLPEQVANKFRNMKIADLLDNPIKYLERDFVTQVSPEVNEELACVNCLIAKKR